jgi:hypothetical protein
VIQSTSKVPEGKGVRHCYYKDTKSLAGKKLFGVLMLDFPAVLFWTTHFAGTRFASSLIAKVIPG